MRGANLQHAQRCQIRSVAQEVALQLVLGQNQAAGQGVTVFESQWAIFLHGGVAGAILILAVRSLLLDLSGR